MAVRGYLTPSLWPFRKTRTGRSFSPWDGSELGPPIHAPADFDLKARLAECGIADVAEPPLEPAALLYEAPSVATRPPLSTLSATVNLPSIPAVAIVEHTPEEKKKFHSTKHARERRQRRTAQDPLRGGADKPLSSSAMKRLRDALGVFVHRRGAASSIVPRPSDDTTIMTHGALHADFSLDDNKLPVAASAFIGLNYVQTQEDCEVTALKALQEAHPELQYVSWSGRDTRLLVHRRGYVFGSLNAPPEDPQWVSVIKRVQEIFQNLSASLCLGTTHLEHTRGDFASVPYGLSMGQGQVRVGRLAHSAHNKSLLNDALKETALKRVANFAAHALQVFFPDVHTFYDKTLAAICVNDPTLERNFTGNAFACASFNLGPQSISYVHRDHLNLPFGLCAITALGDFDHHLGGHLVLWDLGMIIEFPPGTTILIPSAILRHSNTALADSSERCYAFVQYSAGALFRWVECDFQTQKRYFAAGRKFVQSGVQRWRRGVGMFSKFSDLKRRVTVQK